MNLILTWTALSLYSRCHQCASVCAVCHHVVKGMFVWCQGCSHGGHLEHIMNWLKSSAHCPAGCGHLCEYTWAHQKHRSHSWCSVGVGTSPHTSLDLSHTRTPQTNRMSLFHHVGLERSVTVELRNYVCVWVNGGRGVYALSWTAIQEQTQSHLDSYLCWWICI